MHRVITRQCSRACILLAALCVGASSRDDALIGYKEKEDQCTDTNEKCEEWSKGVLSQCIENAYYMRQYCRKSCSVAPFCKTKNDQLPPWEGHATPEGTRLFSTMYPGAYAAAEHHFRRDPNMGSYHIEGQRMRGSPWLHLSSLGIGTYLGDEDEETDAMVSTAIVASVNRGWNCIDTASNYRSGRAEEAVGFALLALRIANVGITRNMLFVSTKAGFIGADLSAPLLSAGRKQGGIGKEDLVGGNCIHPMCLDASLKRSLKLLKLETVDILYLHNVAEAQGALGDVELKTRLAEAFLWLEAARTAGRIQAYGMATWDCFRKPREQGGLQLQTMVKLAEGVAGKNHGFRYVQLPINAQMREAWEEMWQTVEFDGVTKQMTFMEAAARLGVGVFASGPLLEGTLLENSKLMMKVEAAEELAGIASKGTKLLQISRSTPLVTAALIGHKQATNADANVRLTTQEPLDAAHFHSLMARLKSGGPGMQMQ